MLVLMRRAGERVMIGEGTDQVSVKVIEFDAQRGRVLLGFEGARHISILREELLSRHDAGTDRGTVAPTVTLSPEQSGGETTGGICGLSADRGSQEPAGA